MTIDQFSAGMKLRATSTGVIYRVQSVGDERVIARGPWGSTGVDREALEADIETGTIEIASWP
ncbi:hypothetical protein [Halococcus saccharolyticus]|uniref:hypothetical protein n=1 Tax=Halococcus saccharolyticus TaxID=62319 RepID=UPI0006781606|nr:hypothetical protein [Halococcus saccharolyticus]